MQAIIEVAHRLATSADPEVREILDNVVLLLVPSQNPDGQVMVIDHWYKTKGTKLNRVFPDLYHRYTGHDDNRDWFMFTQKETQMAVEMQNRLKPHLTHDMHQQGPMGSRIFVPPYEDPYDRNVHPLIAQEQLQVGQAMATALVAEGKGGVAFAEQYDLWTPARQYMVYHGQPRILTEIASASLADPFVNPAGHAARTAGAALELSAALSAPGVAASADRGLRRHGGLRRPVAHGEVPHVLPRKLLPHSCRLGEPQGGTVRLRDSTLAARSVRDDGAREHHADGAGRGPPREQGVRRGGQDVWRRRRTSSSSRSRTGRSRRRCSRSRCIPTSGCFPEARRNRRTT